jgi:4-hydroxyphenylpyruvate dioxygenase-like putative hemolysin
MPAGPAVRHWPGAKPFVGKIGPMELNIPAIYGIGESTLSFVDRYGERGSIYDVDFIFYPDWQAAWPRWTQGSMRSTT